MGYVRHSADDFSSLSMSRGYDSKSTQQIFKSRTAKPEYLPINITVRESNKSDVNPNPTPIIIASDVTGSMGVMASKVLQQLPNLVRMLNNSVVVTDPHIMLGAIGDLQHDSFPLQVTQFESSTVLCDQAEDLYIESGGGNNEWESYDLPWYFAALKTRTSLDNQRKGYIFTIGDEPPPPSKYDSYMSSKFKQHFGSNVTMLHPSESLEEASERYNVFHLIIDSHGYCRRYPNKVIGQWQQLLGNNALLLNDETALSEVIIAIMMINEGQWTIEEAIKHSVNTDAVKHAFSLIKQ